MRCEDLLEDATPRLVHPVQMAVIPSHLRHGLDDYLPPLPTHLTHTTIVRGVWAMVLA